MLVRQATTCSGVVAYPHTPYPIILSLFPPTANVRANELLPGAPSNATVEDKERQFMGASMESTGDMFVVCQPLQYVCTCMSVCYRNELCGCGCVVCMCVVCVCVCVHVCMGVWCV